MSTMKEGDSIMLELKNVSLSVGDDKDEILKSIDLVLEEKKIYAVTGPNGGGKSSLAKIIMGIITPTAGTVHMDGRDITGLDVTERAQLGIGYAFQHPPRFKGITVRELLGIASSDKKTPVCDLLFRVGLCAQEYLGRELDATLSGGEIKRIEIATVLARKLKIAVFDEPEAGIDLWSFQQLAETFHMMHTQDDTTIMIISHQEKILELADEVILVTDGEAKKNVGKDEIIRHGDITARCMCRPNCGRVGEDDAECVG